MNNEIKKIIIKKVSSSIFEYKKNPELWDYGILAFFLAAYSRSHKVIKIIFFCDILFKLFKNVNIMMLQFFYYMKCDLKGH